MKGHTYRKKMTVILSVASILEACISIERMVFMAHTLITMMNNNLDRFSRPLHTEGVGISLDAIQEQQELNKKHIVMDYISNYWNSFSLVPTAEYVQEALYKIDIDLDLIKNEISRF
jgi:hypothetical protein